MAHTERYSVREVKQPIYVVRDNLIEHEIEHVFNSQEEANYFLIILRKIDDEI